MKLWRGREEEERKRGREEEKKGKGRRDEEWKVEKGAEGAWREGEERREDK